MMTIISIYLWIAVHLTLRQLKVFSSVARHLNFTRAAEEMHLTQPAVSMQIKQVEENVGLPLFEHIGKQLYLTEAGREMYHYSRVVAQQLDEAESVIDALKGVQRGRLAIAVASTANYFAPRLLAAFSEQHPSVTISLDVTNREGLITQLENNDKDLVIMGRPPAAMDLVAEVFTENPLVIIAPLAHPLVQRKQIPLADLQNATFVVREQGSGTRIAMERFFSEQGVRLATGMEMSSNEAIKQAVQAGLGLGIVSMHTLALELETKRLAVLDVQSFPIMRHWYIVHWRSKRLSPIAQAFKEFVLRQGADYVPETER